MKGTLLNITSATFEKGATVGKLKLSKEKVMVVLVLDVIEKDKQYDPKALLNALGWEKRTN